jgi:FkbM family methyltransferase
VGANIGQTARAFASECPRATIYSFEPFPLPFTALAKLAKENKRIRAYQLACGEKETAMTCADPCSASELNKVAMPSPGHPTIEIAITTIDSICQRERISHIDILKTDTEGDDLKVLRGARQMLAGGRVRCIMSEVGFLDDRQHSSFEELFSFLHQFGFHVAGWFQTSYLPNGRCLFSNVLFVS